MRPLFGDLYQFLNRQSDTQSPDTADGKINEFEGNRTVEDIAVADISFFYPNSQKPALTDITLTFRKGERVAIVGPNGAGKTTLARVLLGLYQPHTGSIRVGEIPLTDENRRAWLTHCSAVFQDFTQYHLTRT